MRVTPSSIVGRAEVGLAVREDKKPLTFVSCPVLRISGKRKATECCRDDELIHGNLLPSDLC